jgi:hypothetical protein
LLQPELGRLLGIGITQHDVVTARRKVASNIGGEGRFTCSAFGIGNDNDFHSLASKKLNDDKNIRRLAYLFV